MFNLEHISWVLVVLDIVRKNDATLALGLLPKLNCDKGRGLKECLEPQTNSHTCALLGFIHILRIEILKCLDLLQNNGAIH
jgi:hypothetical protein